MENRMNIQNVTPEDREQVIQFLINYWHSTEMVLSSGIYDCSQLPAFIVKDKQNVIIALITYLIEDERCEIMSLDSLVEGQGLGSQLIHFVIEEAMKKGCQYVDVTTTNDNLNAVAFYQKRGFVLHELKSNVVAMCRKIKPEIPLIGYNNIPIRDEIVLRKII